MRFLLLNLIICSSFFVFGQTVTVWNEDFGTGCNQGQIANGFTTANGTWTVSNQGVNDTESNEWFVSAAEQIGAGDCGEGCGGTNNRTLHVSNIEIPAFGFSADLGAAYNAGGGCGFFFCVATNKLAESPTIDLTSETDLTLTFDYIEFGDGNFDNAELWYFDGGAWTVLDNLPKTICCGGACDGTTQGEFTNYSIPLPLSAENNPNVRIGFFWTNNDDGVGTDPSFAVDNIEITTPDIVLPVTLSDFNIECTNNQNVIEWETESEINNQFFFIEYSEDGKNWEILDSINGKGTTSETSNYYYVHRNKNTEISYYKVTQVDYDGKQEQLFIVSSNCQSENKEIALYPNPSKKEFYINLEETNSNKNIEVKVYSTSGNLIIVRKLNNKSLIRINHNLSSGNYQVLVKDSKGEILATKKLVIID